MFAVFTFAVLLCLSAIIFVASRSFIRKTGRRIFGVISAALTVFLAIVLIVEISAYK